VMFGTISCTHALPSTAPCVPALPLRRHEDHPIFEADLSSKGEAGVRDVRLHARQLQES
jgi:hypothetical protein